jgi:hypothetical protein
MIVESGKKRKSFMDCHSPLSFAITTPSQGQFPLNKRFLLDGEQINLYNIQLTNGIVNSR